MDWNNFTWAIVFLISFIVLCIGIILTSIPSEHIFRFEMFTDNNTVNMINVLLNCSG